MSPRNEVVKKKNYPFKQTTLSDECIGFCLQMTINMHLFLAWSLQMGHKMSNEIYLERLTHIANGQEAKRKWI